MKICHLHGSLISRWELNCEMSSIWMWKRFLSMKVIWINLAGISPILVRAATHRVWSGRSGGYLWGDGEDVCEEVGGHDDWCCFSRLELGWRVGCCLASNWFPLIDTESVFRSSSSFFQSLESPLPVAHRLLSQTRDVYCLERNVNKSLFPRSVS